MNLLKYWWTSDIIFAVQKNFIWVRINEYKEESLEEEIEINNLLGDFIKK